APRQLAAGLLRRADRTRRRDERQEPTAQQRRQLAALQGLQPRPVGGVSAPAAAFPLREDRVPVPPPAPQRYEHCTAPPFSGDEGDPGKAAAPARTGTLRVPV